MIINLSRGYAKMSKLKDGKFRDVEEPLPLNLKEYNDLYAKKLEVASAIKELEKQKSDLMYEMAKELIYPYKFGDRVTVTLFIESFYERNCLHQKTFRGVINYDYDSQCLCISSINKDGSVSSRFPRKLNYIPNSIEVTDYEE